MTSDRTGNEVVGGIMVRFLIIVAIGTTIGWAGWDAPRQGALAGIAVWAGMWGLIGILIGILTAMSWSLTRKRMEGP